MDHTKLLYEHSIVFSSRDGVPDPITKHPKVFEMIYEKQYNDNLETNGVPIETVLKFRGNALGVAVAIEVYRK